jgi:sugar transferase (PEP-CTERM/EpsH1 system associated)
MDGRSAAPPLVLHVIHHLHIGGMENGLVNLINNMPSASYRHAIACVEDYSDFRERITRADVEVFALHRSRIGLWRLRRELFRLCRELRPAIVHSRNQSGLDALLPARLAGVKHCVHGEHGWEATNLYGDAWKPIVLRKLHSPLVSRYVTVSKDLERFLVRRVGVAAARITHICNGVDTGRFAPAVERQRAWLPAEFRAQALILIGTVGRLQPVKDQATLLRAFSQLVGEQPHLRERLRLLIVGGGPLETDLRSLADSLGIAALTFFTGARDNVADALQALDVFVLPSLNEGISNTLLEAMAAGIPLIASAAGGNVELIEEGLYGRFFATGDVAALSRLLSEYASDGALRQAHGRAARQAAVERFSLTSMVSRYQAVYDQVRGQAEATR